MKIVLLAAAIILGIFLVFSPLYILFGIGKRFYHNILEWHIPDTSIKFVYDGCSNHAVCKYCRKSIMQDSQGNWFCSPKYTIEDLEAMGYNSAEDFLKDRFRTSITECDFDKIDFSYDYDIDTSCGTENLGYIDNNHEN